MIEIKAAVRLLVDEGFRISENHSYIDFDGEENGKTVWEPVAISSKIFSHWKKQ
jgi:hypothetical protein